MFKFKFRRFKKWRDDRHVARLDFPTEESYVQFASHLTVILRAGLFRAEDSDEGLSNAEWQELVCACLTATIRLSDSTDEEARKLYRDALELCALRQIAPMEGERVH